ncbi:hypothetical protein ACOMHN_008155 [Nucella lapillus]
MAEQEAAQAQEEVDDEITPGYKPPAPKSLEEIVKLDTDDESLVKYKKALLGETGGADGGKKEVTVKKLTINVEGREPVVLDLTGPKQGKEKLQVVLKEGCEYTPEITFNVKGEIVHGLRYLQMSYRKGIKVDTDKKMLGSFGPKADDYNFKLPVDEAPKGLVARGDYTVKSKFVDDDKTVWLEWEWILSIKKDFE